MNRIHIILSVLIILGCKNETKLYPYTVIIEKDEINYNLTGYVLGTKEDTVMVESDSAAYLMGLAKARGAEMSFDNLKERLGVGKVYSFRVIDSLGVSVGERLGQLKIKSINNRFTVIPDSTKALYRLY